MKKYLSLLLMLTISIFIGVKLVDAAGIESLDFSDASFSYVSSTEAKEDGYKYTTVTVYGKSTAAATLSGTQTWELKYKSDAAKKDGVSVFSKVSNGSYASIVDSSIKKTENGGTFDITYNGKSVSGAGEKVELFTLQIKQLASEVPNDENCGGYLSPIKSGTNTETTTNPVTPGDTGVSAPVAFLAVGTLVGIGIIAVSSRKTKMHRI